MELGPDKAKLLDPGRENEAEPKLSPTFRLLVYRTYFLKRWILIRLWLMNALLNLLHTLRRPRWRPLGTTEVVLRTLVCNLLTPCVPFGQPLAARTFLESVLADLNFAILLVR